MQNPVFEAMGLDYACLAFDVSLDRVAKAVDAIRVLGLRGACRSHAPSFRISTG